MLFVGSSGGSLTTPSGARVDVPSSWLQANHTLTVVHDPTATIALGVPGWQTAPGTVTVRLDGPSTHGSAPQGPVVTMAFRAADAAAIAAAQTAIVELTAPDGHTALVAGALRIDATRNVATVGIPRSAFDAAVQARVALVVDAPGGAPPQPGGGRYWNGTAWQPSPYPTDATKRTVVLVHGVFSSVEQAFPGPCPSAIASAGGFAQTYGFDYDWTRTPDALAQPFADFVNSLPNASVDIEAHSYGTIVTLAALPLIKKTVGHVVLLGGPLPLNGSPQATHTWLIDLFVWAIKDEYPAYASQIEAAEKSGMIADLVSGSPMMTSIAQGLKAMPSLPAFVQVAGTHPLPVETDPIVNDVYADLYGSTVNDGVVEQASALTPQGSAVSTRSFPLYHTQLECDPGVVGYVGPLVTH